MTRNVTLDYLKLVLSIMVIILHFPFGIYGDTFIGTFYKSGIGRMAVPLFFIINGYFFNDSNLKKLRKYVGHLLVIYIIWQSFYSFFYANYNIKTFIFNIIIGYEHIWYVQSLIVGIIIFFIIRKISKNNKLLLFSSILMFIIGYVIQYNYTHDYFLYRNGLFWGFPFISIGYLIKKCSPFRNKNLLVCVIMGFIISYFEIILFKNHISDLLLSSLLICPAFFIYILSKSEIKESDSYISDLSAAIYFSHPFILKIIVTYGDENNIIFMLPMMIVLSILFASVIVNINKRLKIFL